MEQTTTWSSRIATTVTKKRRTRTSLTRSNLMAKTHSTGQRDRPDTATDGKMSCEWDNDYGTKHWRTRTCEQAEQEQTGITAMGQGYFPSGHWLWIQDKNESNKEQISAAFSDDNRQITRHVNMGVELCGTVRGNNEMAWSENKMKEIESEFITKIGPHSTFERQPK